MLSAFSKSGVALRAAGMVVALLTLSSFYFTYHQPAPKVSAHSTIEMLPEDFSWMSYVDQNSGLAEMTYKSVIKNFDSVGKSKGRPYTQVTPPVIEIDSLHRKIDIFNRACPSKTFDTSSHNLVVYRISDSDADFLSLAKLNLMLFLTTIDEDPCHSAAPTFYVFSIANGAKNALFQYIPTRSNIAVLSWYQRTPSEEVYNYLRALEVITPRMISKFGAVFLLSVDVRGPLTGRYKSEWVQRYRHLLDRNNVAVVSPIIQCNERRPKIAELYGYALAVRTEYIILVLEQFKIAKYKPTSSESRFRNILSLYFSLNDNGLLSKSKFRAASIAQFMMDNRHTYYDDDCKAKNNLRPGSKSVTYSKLDKDSETTESNNETDTMVESVYLHNSWCYDATMQMFIPWGKVYLRSTEFDCPNYVTSMYQYLAQFSTVHPMHAAQIESTMGSINIYETVYVDWVRDVFVQYSEELRRLHLATNTTGTTNVNVVTTLPATPATTNNNLVGAIASSIVNALTNTHASAPTTALTNVVADGEVKNMKFTHTYPIPYTSNNHYTNYVYDTTPDNSQVCFLVRTSTMHDRIEHPTKGLHYAELDAFDFIASLQKQTNPNWRAYMFLTDDRPFSDRLREIVLGARDSRVVYYEIDEAHRPAFTKVDGGYTATDYVLRNVLQDSTCKFFTVTNADNSYGSEVVQRVLEYSVTLYGKSSTYTSPSRSTTINKEGEARSRLSSVTSEEHSPSTSTNKENTDTTTTVTTAEDAPSTSSAASAPATTTTAVVPAEAAVSSKAITVTPPMLLAPLDSRNFNIEYQHRRFSRASYDEGCRGLNALLEFNMLTYTTQPLPRVGRVDLASLFLNREALLKENVVFANFTDPVEYPCLGCQDGYLAEYLTTKVGWEFARMPIDGLKSIAFHGPSPTLCVAAGNVWFDHPSVNKVGCYTRGTVHALRVKDHTLRNPIYDWSNYDGYFGVCIRFSKYGFKALPEQDHYITSTTPPHKAEKIKQDKKTLLGYLSTI
eukprot:gene13099-15101_t